jgi:hypothetical protein
MKYEDFEKFVREKCVYETIYDDSEGRQILVVQMLDAYGMVNKAQREWQGLTDEEVKDIGCDFATLGGDIDAKDWFAFYLAIEAKLKEKNSGL